MIQPGGSIKDEEVFKRSEELGISMFVGSGRSDVERTLMKVLVLGGGGREHAVVHAFSKSKIVAGLHCCRQSGISQLAECHNGSPTDHAQMVSMCKKA